MALTQVTYPSKPNRAEKPVQGRKCPRCNSPNWMYNKPIDEWYCLTCGHRKEWSSMFTAPQQSTIRGEGYMGGQYSNNQGQHNAVENLKMRRNRVTDGMPVLEWTGWISWGKAKPPKLCQWPGGCKGDRGPSAGVTRNRVVGVWCRPHAHQYEAETGLLTPLWKHIAPDAYTKPVHVRYCDDPDRRNKTVILVGLKVDTAITETALQNGWTAICKGFEADTDKKLGASLIMAQDAQREAQIRSEA